MTYCSRHNFSLLISPFLISPQPLIASVLPFRRLLITLGVILAAAALCSRAEAGVVVLSNQTMERVGVTIVEPDGRRTQYDLDPKGVAAVPADAAVTAIFNDGGTPRRLKLQPSGIYCFRKDARGIRLEYEELPGLPADRPATSSSPPKREEVYTVPVRILADDKEPTVQRVWEKRYRQRLAEASDIFERYCRVRFKVVSVGMWTSNSNATQLQELVQEFEREVKPGPARLAIGFTGQYKELGNERRMGGTRGPLRPHILIREWGRQLAEPDRLEMLVHELGHFLGAVHSSEDQSVMRPDIGDRQARARAFHIGFDARNTLALYLVGEELRTRPLLHLCQLPSATKSVLRGAYRSLAADLPSDTSAPRFLAMLDQSPGLVLAPPERLRAVIAGARTVVQSVSEAARQNRQLSEKVNATAGEAFRCEGDELSEYYVRRAAAAASRLPPNDAAGAFLLGLGAALDDSDLLWNSLAVGQLWRQLESQSERGERLSVLGSPTMQGRRDLAQHFTVSAALTVLVGPEAAEGAGILKEMADARRGSGFSFVDFSADLAGILFADAVSQKKIPLSRLENSFAVADFLPDPSGLKEGIDWSDFVEAYGDVPDRRLFAEREALRKRILSLPGYK